MKTLRKLLAITIVVCPTLFAQPFVRSMGGIPVNTGGGVLEQPFTGGIDAPRHQFVDIDGDGDLDLFLLDNDGSVTFYRNDGTPQSPHFVFCRNCITIPQFAYWFYFVDLNSDGKYDLCTDDSSTGVRYYVNIGSAQSPDFMLQAATMLDSSGAPVVGAPIGAPTFADINGDSLLDFVSSNINGSFNYYVNVGSRSTPLFKFVTGTFENIIILGDTCPGPRLAPSSVEWHGGGNLQFADIDANGTQDMFYGDLFSHGVFYMRNDGTPSVPDIHCVTNRYPDQLLVTSGFNQPTLEDIDGDGTLDLFVGLLNTTPRHNFWYYKNVGTPSTANFQLQTEDFLPSLDVGSSAHPVFADIDGNGTEDLVCGTLEGKLWLFTNTGTQISPSFVLSDTGFAGISGNFTYAPAFVDIDHDGDLDLFVGRFDGRIKFYRNTGTPAVPVYSAEASLLDTVNVNRNASPAFADLDGDGDEDLLVGKANGKLSYYRNDGNDSEFIPILVDNAFGGISAGEDAVPVLRYNAVHRCYDLYVGGSDGRLSYYENMGDSAHPVFLLQTDHFGNIDQLRECVPAFTDIDGDGDADLFVGTSKGGIHYYRNDLLSDVREPRSTPEEPSAIELLQNFPNPFNPNTNIEFQTSRSGFVKVEIVDGLGRGISTLVNGMISPGKHSVRWDALRYPAGAYYCRLTAGGRTITRKMMIVK